MASRLRLALDGQWKFSPTDTLDTDHCSLLTVPSPWQADARFRDHVGTAWYQREFELPAEWLAKDRVVMLGFGAVDYFAEVWLNDIRIGQHEGGYLPFEFDATQAAYRGTNKLTVRVEDPLDIFPEIPHGKQSWYGMLSGIWQSVWVESRAATHIGRVKISTNGAQLSVEVSGRGALTGRLTAEVIAPTGEVAARAESLAPRFSLPLERPLRWSPDEPNLYTLRVSTGTDEVTETFGFRAIEAREGRILLNGRPFYLRAALDQDYYPLSLCTPPSQEYIEEEFRKAKEMGLNCLRVHIKIADPRYYAAADKVGLLIWTELPNHNFLSEDAKRRARETLAGMVERDWNHPSIGIWTIINESWGIDLTDLAQRAWLAETYDWLKSLDPTRLVVDNSACWGNAHLATDLADFHNYYAMPDHYDQWNDWVANYARRPWWLFAHDYQDHAAWTQFARDPWHADEQAPAAEVRARGNEPLLVSEFGNWGLPDVTKLYEGNKGAAPWWFDTGLGWGDGVVYPHGIEERFREYQLDRIFPSLTALSEASQRLQFEALKYEIEQIRRHASIQGYVITEFTDLHWECNGLLDMDRNPKVHYPRLRSINADDMLIPLWERMAFSSGETCEMKISFSHYSPLEIKNGMLNWEVISEQSSVVSNQVASGQWSIGKCSPFGVNELGVVSFEVPQVEQPTKARLQLHLISDGILLAATEQEVYLFPKLASPVNRRTIYAPKLNLSLEHSGIDLTENLASAEVAVVTTLDDACREFLLRGGKVLFLAEEDDALQTYIPGIGIEPRRGTSWQGDWASSFGWHRFDTIPTDHTINFAFADLTPEHVIHGFTPRDFALNVYAGLFVGWLHKPIPTIARRRVQQGELLVSTFRLTKNLETNPLAKYLLCELLELLA